MKFKKIQHEIEAMHVTIENMVDVAVWCRGHQRGIGLPASQMCIEFYNKSTKEAHRANVGSWIIKGIEGEFYPCTDDIFQKSYTGAAAVEGASDKPVEPLSIKVNSLNSFVKLAYGIAKKKGWHDVKRTPLEIHMLIVSEIAEASEQVRNGMPHIYEKQQEEKNNEETWKPEGEAIELADAVIRIMDYFGSKDWDLEEAMIRKMRYNNTRSHRHGGKVL